MLSLPTTSCGDAAVVCGGLSPLLEPTLVLLLTATQQDEAEDDEDAADAGAASAAASKRRARGKADLRMELGKNDPYALLELDHLRWRATADDVRKSYRRLVLLHHPDKKAATAEEGAPDAEEDDEMFKAISDAFELLSTPKKRREFDSLDEFDDTVPTADDAAAGGFFGTFGPVFERNSRWSERGGCPLLGGEDAPDETVAAFYNFWFDFQSWRDFADADEFDPNDAGFREEKRWMERQNEKLRLKRRREEKARVLNLVEVSYSLDPRVHAMQLREKEARANAKAERNRQKAAARNAEAEAKQAAAERAEAEAEAEAERARADAAERRRLKERAAKGLRKARGRLRALCKESRLCEEEEWEKLCGNATAERSDQLETLCAGLERDLAGPEPLAAAQARLREALAAVDAATEAEATPPTGAEPQMSPRGKSRGADCPYTSRHTSRHFTK